jgi:hypothetical protein
VQNRAARSLMAPGGAQAGLPPPLLPLTHRGADNQEKKSDDLDGAPDLSIRGILAEGMP